MFSHETEEKRTKKVKIPNAKPKIVKKMLEFIHTGKVEDLKSVAAKLLQLAEQYQVKELCDMCADQMCGEFKVETIIRQLKLVARYGHLTDFKARVLQFARKNSDEISRLPGWREFGKYNVDVVMDILAVDVYA